MTAAILTNIVFWNGVAIGGVVFAALVEVTGGRWPGPLRGMAERFRWFLPLSLLSTVILMGRSDAFYPWARQVSATGWFTPWIVALRVDLIAAALYGSAFVFCSASRRARENPAGRAARAATARAIAFLVVYALADSLLVVDTVMSLQPRWTSTLFPAYVFTGNVYCGMAAVATAAAWHPDVARDTLNPPRSRDMANLLAGTALFWFYLFWSQFLVIWYGNITAELGFVIPRLDGLRGLAWTVLAMCCAIPAMMFVPRCGKQASVLRIVAPVILLGMWLERWMLVAPGVPSRSLPAAILTTAAFAALFAVSIRRDYCWSRERRDGAAGRIRTGAI